MGGAAPLAGPADTVMTADTLSAVFEHPLRRLRTETRWTYVVD